MKFPHKPYRSHGGARVPHCKNTKYQDTEIMPAPSTVTIPMLQHIGAPCKPVVKIGDRVTVGQVIGDSEAFVSAPIHSSISGTVKKIEKIRLPNVESVDSVVIESDGLMEKYSAIKPPKITNSEELVEAVRNSGLVGLGGAGFPAHVKLKIPKDCKIDTLIVNAAECEPYITSDNRVILEEYNAVIDAIDKIKKLLNIERVIVAIEGNKPKAIKLLNIKLEGFGPNVGVLKLKSRYPQGAEKVLIKVCTNRVVPQGKLPSNVGCLVMNVTSLAFLSNYMKTGMPLVSKRITIDGSAIRNPKNIIVPIGTKISDAIEFTGGYKKEAKKLIMGGPMMGIALINDEVPVLKQNNAILAFAEDAILKKENPCIRCGKCVESCPMKLMPTLLEKHSALKNIDDLVDLNIMSCMECGCCSFNCPAGRNLVQSIKIGKLLLKNASKR